MPIATAAQPEAAANSRLYRAVWRWHFYAGLYVIPFLVMLAVTGFFMMLFTTYLPEHGERLAVAPQSAPLAAERLAEAARATLGPDAVVTDIRTPYDAATPMMVTVAAGGVNHVLAVNPYTAEIMRSMPQEATWNLFFERIHGTLLLGTTGDWLIEIAASLGIILAVTGLYLWWPRGRGLAAALLPAFGARGRSLWKSLHETAGVWVAIILIFFMVTGLAWTSVWGERFMQAWSTFPAEKWDSVPLSDKTHASLNGTGEKQVPWGLEQTLLPASGSAAGAAVLPSGTELDLTSMVELGRKLGIEGRMRITVPQDETAVWTISQNSMSYDGASPTLDRTVHVDQYTGKVLADARYADYAIAAKAMAVGIALHEGQLGLWNFALNALFCLACVFLCVSGIVMWWKRRPAGRLGSPRYPRDYRVPAGVLGLGALLAIAFPMGGLAIAFFAIVDFLLPQRLKQAGAQ
jgi:uncharacterized iron-regulated membrane protein